MVKIESSEIKYNSYSWFDDHGRVFTYQGKLFRGIYPEHEEYILKLIQSGLIDKLVSNNLFPETKISDYHSDEFPLIIEHAFISPQTYPFEWSFTMLKDAAINVLKINQIANEFGYQLKDCHGFNVMFDGLTPKFVDFGSFIPCNVANKDWYALDEFYRYYIYPLRLWSAGQGFWARNSLMVDFGLMPHSAYKQFRHKLLSFFKAIKI